MSKKDKNAAKYHRTSRNYTTISSAESELNAISGWSKYNWDVEHTRKLSTSTFKTDERSTISGTTNRNDGATKNENTTEITTLKNNKHTKKDTSKHQTGTTEANLSTPEKDYRSTNYENRDIGLNTSTQINDVNDNSTTSSIVTDITTQTKERNNLDSVSDGWRKFNWDLEHTKKKFGNNKQTTSISKANLTTNMNEQTTNKSNVMPLTESDNKTEESDKKYEVMNISSITSNVANTVTMADSWIKYNWDKEHTRNRNVTKAERITADSNATLTTNINKQTTNKSNVIPLTEGDNKTEGNDKKYKVTNISTRTSNVTNTITTDKEATQYMSDGWIKFNWDKEHTRKRNVTKAESTTPSTSAPTTTPKLVLIKEKLIKPRRNRRLSKGKMSILYPDEFNERFKIYKVRAITEGKPEMKNTKHHKKGMGKKHSSKKLRHPLKSKGAGWIKYNWDKEHTRKYSKNSSAAFTPASTTELTTNLQGNMLFEPMLDSKVGAPTDLWLPSETEVPVDSKRMIKRRSRELQARSEPDQKPVTFKWPEWMQGGDDETAHSETNYVATASPHTSKGTSLLNKVSGWKKYNWDIERTRILHTTKWIATTKPQKNATAKTTLRPTSRRPSKSTKKGYEIEPEPENIVLPDYEMTIDIDEPTGPPTEEGEALFKNKLFSKADYLLNPSNFEATLGTTKEAKHNYVLLNNVEVSDSDEVKDYYEKVSRILNEEIVFPSEEITEVSFHEKKILDNSADVLTQEERKSGTSEGTTSTILTGNFSYRPIPTKTLSKEDGKQGWQMFNWDVEHTRSMSRTKETSFSGATATKETTTTGTTGTTATTRKETGFEIVNEEEEIELPTPEIVPLQITQKNTGDTLELNSNDTDYEFKKKLFSHAEFLLNYKNFEATLIVTKENPDLVFTDKLVNEKEELTDYDSEDKGTTEIISELGEKEKQQLFSIADELLKSENPTKEKGNLRTVTTPLKTSSTKKKTISQKLEKTPPPFSSSTQSIKHTTSTIQNIYISEEASKTDLISQEKHSFSNTSKENVSLTTPVSAKSSYKTSEKSLPTNYNESTTSLTLNSKELLTSKTMSSKTLPETSTSFIMETSRRYSDTSPILSITNGKVKSVNESGKEPYTQLPTSEKNKETKSTVQLTTNQSNDKSKFISTVELETESSTKPMTESASEKKNIPQVKEMSSTRTSDASMNESLLTSSVEESRPDQSTTKNVTAKMVTRTEEFTTASTARSRIYTNYSKQEYEIETTLPSTIENKPSELGLKQSTIKNIPESASTTTEEGISSSIKELLINYSKEEHQLETTLKSTKEIKSSENEPSLTITSMTTSTKKSNTSEDEYLITSSDELEADNSKSKSVTELEITSLEMSEKVFNLTASSEEPEQDHSSIKNIMEVSTPGRLTASSSVKKMSTGSNRDESILPTTIENRLSEKNLYLTPFSGEPETANITIKNILESKTITPGLWTTISTTPMQMPTNKAEYQGETTLPDLKGSTAYKEETYLTASNKKFGSAHNTLKNITATTEEMFSSHAKEEYQMKTMLASTKENKLSTEELFVTSNEEPELDYSTVIKISVSKELNTESVNTNKKSTSYIKQEYRSSLPSSHIAHNQENKVLTTVGDDFTKEDNEIIFNLPNIAETSTLCETCSTDQKSTTLTNLKISNEEMQHISSQFSKTSKRVHATETFNAEIMKTETNLTSSNGYEQSEALTTQSSKSFETEDYVTKSQNQLEKKLLSTKEGKPSEEESHLTISTEHVPDYSTIKNLTESEVSAEGYQIETTLLSTIGSKPSEGESYLSSSGKPTVKTQTESELTTSEKWAIEKTTSELSTNYTKEGYQIEASQYTITTPSEEPGSNKSPRKNITVPNVFTLKEEIVTSRTADMSTNYTKQENQEEIRVSSTIENRPFKVEPSEVTTSERWITASGAISSSSIQESSPSGEELYLTTSSEEPERDNSTIKSITKSKVTVPEQWTTPSDTAKEKYKMETKASSKQSSGTTASIKSEPNQSSVKKIMQSETASTEELATETDIIQDISTSYIKEEYQIGTTLPRTQETKIKSYLTTSTKKAGPEQEKEAQTAGKDETIHQTATNEEYSEEEIENFLNLPHHEKTGTICEICSEDEISATQNGTTGLVTLVPTNPVPLEITTNNNGNKVEITSDIDPHLTVSSNKNTSEVWTSVLTTIKELSVSIAMDEYEMQTALSSTTESKPFEELHLVTLSEEFGPKNHTKSRVVTITTPSEEPVSNKSARKNITEPNVFTLKGETVTSRTADMSTNYTRQENQEEIRVSSTIENRPFKGEPSEVTTSERWITASRAISSSNIQESSLSGDELYLTSSSEEPERDNSTIKSITESKVTVPEQWTTPSDTAKEKYKMETKASSKQSPGTTASIKSEPKHSSLKKIMQSETPSKEELATETEIIQEISTSYIKEEYQIGTTLPRTQETKIKSYLTTSTKKAGPEQEKKAQTAGKDETIHQTTTTEEYSEEEIENFLNLPHHEKTGTICEICSEDEISATQNGTTGLVTLGPTNPVPIEITTNNNGNKVEITSEIDPHLTVSSNKNTSEVWTSVLTTIKELSTSIAMDEYEMQTALSSTTESKPFEKLHLVTLSEEFGSKNNTKSRVVTTNELATVSATLKEMSTNVTKGEYQIETTLSITKGNKYSEEKSSYEKQGQNLSATESIIETEVTSPKDRIVVSATVQPLTISLAKIPKPEDSATQSATKKETSATYTNKQYRIETALPNTRESTHTKTELYLTPSIKKPSQEVDTSVSDARDQTNEVYNKGKNENLFNLPGNVEISTLCEFCSEDEISSTVSQSHHNSNQSIKTSDRVVQTTNIFNAKTMITENTLKEQHEQSEVLTSPVPISESLETKEYEKKLNNDNGSTRPVTTGTAKSPSIEVVTKYTYEKNKINTTLSSTEGSMHSEFVPYLTIFRDKNTQEVVGTVPETVNEISIKYTKKGNQVGTILPGTTEIFHTEVDSNSSALNKEPELYHSTIKTITESESHITDFGNVSATKHETSTNYTNEIPRTNITLLGTKSTTRYFTEVEYKKHGTAREKLLEEIIEPKDDTTKVPENENMDDSLISEKITSLNRNSNITETTNQQEKHVISTSLRSTKTNDIKSKLHEEVSDKNELRNFTSVSENIGVTEITDERISQTITLENGKQDLTMSPKPDHIHDKSTEINDDKLYHFTTNVNNSLCQLCVENDSDLLTQADIGSSTVRRLEKRTTNNKDIEIPDYGDVHEEQIFHFPENEKVSTLCDLCSENDYTTTLEGISKNNVPQKTTTFMSQSLTIHKVRHTTKKNGQVPMEESIANVKDSSDQEKEEPVFNFANKKETSTLCEICTAEETSETREHTIHTTTEKRGKSITQTHSTKKHKTTKKQETNLPEIVTKLSSELQQPRTLSTKKILETSELVSDESTGYSEEHTISTSDFITEQLKAKSGEENEILTETTEYEPKENVTSGSTDISAESGTPSTSEAKLKTFATSENIASKITSGERRKETTLRSTHETVDTLEPNETDTEKETAEPVSTDKDVKEENIDRKENVEYKNSESAATVLKVSPSAENEAEEEEETTRAGKISEHVEEVSQLSTTKNFIEHSSKYEETLRVTSEEGIKETTLQNTHETVNTLEPTEKETLESVSSAENVKEETTENKENVEYEKNSQSTVLKASAAAENEPQDEEKTTQAEIISETTEKGTHLSTTKISIELSSEYEEALRALTDIGVVNEADELEQLTEPSNTTTQGTIKTGSSINTEEQNTEKTEGEIETFSSAESTESSQISIRTSDEITEKLEATVHSEVTQITEGTRIRETTEEVKIETNKNEETESIKSTEISEMVETSGKTGGTATTEESEINVETTEGMEITDSTKTANGSEMTQTIEGSKISQTAESSEITQNAKTKSSEEAVTTEATEGFELTQIASSTISETAEKVEGAETSEKVEGAGTSESMETESTEQITEKVETTKGTEGSEITEVTERTPISETTEKVEGAGTSESIETESTELITEKVETTKATEASEITQVTEGTQISETTEKVEGARTSESIETESTEQITEKVETTKATEASEITQVTEGTQISETTEKVEGARTSESIETESTERITEKVETTKATEAADITEGTQFSEATVKVEGAETSEKVEGAGTSESIETESTEKINEKVETTKATEASELTEVTEGTQLSETTEKVEGAGTSESIETESTEQIIEKVETTKATEASEITQVAEGTQISETTEKVEGAGTSESIETESTEKITEKVETIKATKASEITEVTEYTKISKTTEKLEGAGTSESIETESTEQIIEKVETTKATEASEITQVAESTQISETTEKVEGAGTSESIETESTEQITEKVETIKATKAAEITEVTEGTQISETTEKVEGAGTSESIETESTEQITEKVETIKATEASEITEVTEGTQISETTEKLEGAGTSESIETESTEQITEKVETIKATEASEITEVTEGTQISETTEKVEGAGTSESIETESTEKITEKVETIKATEVSEITEVTEGTQISETTEKLEGVGTSESIETESTEQIIEKVETSKATEASEITEVTEGTQISETTEKIEGAGTSESIESESTEQITEKVETTKATEASEITEVTEGTQISETTEKEEGAGTSESIGTESTEQITEKVETTKATEDSEITQVTEGTQISETTEKVEGAGTSEIIETESTEQITGKVETTKATEASEITEVTEGTQISETTEKVEGAGTSESIETESIEQITEKVETTKATEASEITEVTEVTQISETTEKVEGAGTSESIETESIEQITEKVETTKATEDSEITQVTEGTQISETTEKVEGAGTSEIIETESTEQITGKVETTKATEASEITEVTEGTQISETTEKVEGAGTSESIETESIEQITEKVETTKATEDSEITQVTEGTQISETTEKVEGAGTSEIIETESTEQITGKVETTKATEASEITEVTEGTQISETTEKVEGAGTSESIETESTVHITEKVETTKATEASEITEVTEGTEINKTTEKEEGAGTSESIGTEITEQITEKVETTKATEASEITEVTEVTQISETTEKVEGAGTSESIESESTEQITEKVETTKATEASEITEVAEGTEINKTTEKEEGAGTSESIGTESTEQITEKVETTKATEASEITELTEGTEINKTTEKEEGAGTSESIGTESTEQITEKVETTKATEASEITEVTEGTQISETTEKVEGAGTSESIETESTEQITEKVETTKATEASEVTEVTEGTKINKTTEKEEGAETSESIGTKSTEQITEKVETTKATEASEITEVTEVTQISETTEKVEGAGTSESIESESTEQITEKVETKKATEASEITEVAEGTEINKTTEKEEGAGTSESIGTESTEQITEKVETTKATEASEITELTEGTEINKTTEKEEGAGTSESIGTESTEQITEKVETTKATEASEITEVTEGTEINKTTEKEEGAGTSESIETESTEQITEKVETTKATEASEITEVTEGTEINKTTEKEEGAETSESIGTKSTEQITEKVETTKATEASEITEVTEGTQISETTEKVEGAGTSESIETESTEQITEKVETTKATEASEITEVTEGTEINKTTEKEEGAGTSESIGTESTEPITEKVETTKATEASEITEVTEVTQISETTEKVEGAGTSESIESESTEQITEKVETTKATEASEITEVTEGTEINKTTEKEEGAGTSESIGTESTEQITEKVETTKATEASEITEVTEGTEINKTTEKEEGAGTSESIGTESTEQITEKVETTKATEASEITEVTEGTQISETTEKVEGSGTSESIETESTEQITEKIETTKATEASEITEVTEGTEINKTTEKEEGAETSESIGTESTEQITEKVETTNATEASEITEVTGTQISETTEKVEGAGTSESIETESTEQITEKVETTKATEASEITEVTEGTEINKTTEKEEGAGTSESIGTESTEQITEKVETTKATEGSEITEVSEGTEISETTEKVKGAGTSESIETESTEQITQKVEASKATEASEITQFTEGTLISETTEKVEGAGTSESIETESTELITEKVETTKATEGSEITVVTKGTQISETTEKVEVAGTSESIETKSTEHITEKVKTTKATEGSEITQFTEGTQISETTEKVEGGGTSESIETESTEQITEKVETTKATEALEITQVTEGTQISETTEKVEGALPSESRETESTEQITEKIETTKAVEGSEITQVTEGTQIRETTEKVEGTGTSKSIETESIEQITKKVETTKATEGSEVTQTAEGTQISETMENSEYSGMSEIIKTESTEEVETIKETEVSQITQLTEGTQINKETEKVEGTETQEGPETEMVPHESTESETVVISGEGKEKTEYSTERVVENSSMYDEAINVLTDIGIVDESAELKNLTESSSGTYLEETVHMKGTKNADTTESTRVSDINSALATEVIKTIDAVEKSEILAITELNTEETRKEGITETTEENSSGAGEFSENVEETESIEDMLVTAGSEDTQVTPSWTTTETFKVTENIEVTEVTEIHENTESTQNQISIQVADRLRTTTRKLEVTEIAESFKAKTTEFIKTSEVFESVKTEISENKEITETAATITNRGSQNTANEKITETQVGTEGSIYTLSVETEITETQTGNEGSINTLPAETERTGSHTGIESSILTPSLETEIIEVQTGTEGGTKITTTSGLETDDALKLLTDAGVFDDFDLNSITEGTYISESELATLSVTTHVKNEHITSQHMPQSSEGVSDAAKEEQLFHFSKGEEGTTICDICSEVEGSEEAHKSQGTEEASTTKQEHEPKNGSTLKQVAQSTQVNKAEGETPKSQTKHNEGAGTTKGTGATEQDHSIETKGHTKTKVVIVNNSGKKLEKLNDSVLEDLLHKPVSDLSLEYIDLNTSRAPESDYKSKNTEDILRNSPSESCDKKDFDSNSNCICDVDSYLIATEEKMEKGDTINLKDYHCSKFLRLKEGLIIGNNSKPLKRKRRSLLYLSNLSSKSDVIENDDIENVFNGDYDLQTSDKNIFALPGSDTKITCYNEYNKSDNQEMKAAKYTWEFKGYDSPKGDTLPGSESVLVIHNVEVKNHGNYSCTSDDNPKETFHHELEIITFPIYKIKIQTFYAVNDTCSLEDGDILYSYLPDLMGSLLCGQSRRLCKVDMQRPRCLSKDEENFFNVTMSATMNPVHNIFPKVDDEKCDINCKLKAYDNMVGLVHKNAKMVQQLPVLSKLTEMLNFTPKKPIEESTSNINTKPPKIITTCQGGYGVEKEKQRVCVLCPKHTYSEEEEAICKICPPGQYQPTPGSKTCVVCSSPVDDSMCLRMLYSDTKLFKIYVGVAFGMVMVIILILVYWSSSGRNHRDNVRFEDPLKHRGMRKRRGDIENAALEPLLTNQALERKKRATPPKVPPPDF